ncbi:trypsin-like serine peptidase [Bradyrhizobium australafricanum]|uniref:trypsin-like serine peptidase n=1 Tax=Bradyrhizobium australafricanum TaxID=2821406 RepID=UPI001CE36766|nr:serine protease [Bradyrhizobium australafricanum]MCA6098181.1 trypsin-like peptidase domain-containing protein [Bradyrhizobium australafricanum]
MRLKGIFATAFAWFVSTGALAMSLSDIQDSVASRVVQIVPARGGELGAGFLIGAANGQILIATAHHVVAAPNDGEAETNFEIRWTSRPDGCSDRPIPKSVHHLVGLNGGPAADVALVVADLSCAINVRQVPSAWAGGTPSPGSRFSAIVPAGDPPTTKFVRFYFDDDCLKKNRCVRMERLELTVGGQVNEPGMSGSPVVSKAGLVGLVRGSNSVISEPVLGLIKALCGEKEGHMTIPGFDSAKVKCMSSPSGAVIPSVFADAGKSAGCDPKIGQRLHDMNEIGIAYRCRLDLLEKNWTVRKSALDCRRWELCRDDWFATVSDAGFVLGLHPPDEWEDLLSLLGLRSYPVDFVLSNPDRVADFRKEFQAHGFD